MTTETGAGQWGTALAMACAYLELDCKVFMVKCSYEQKPFRREVMRTYGASVDSLPLHGDGGGPEDPGSTSGNIGKPWLRHLRGPLRWPLEARDTGMCWEVY